MDTGIGSTLREARNRRKIDLSEAEEATKIRSRYLRAMENEEWDGLPGGSYTRGFIRTYASFLGLDGERLADDYRHGAEAAALGGERAIRSEPAAASARSPRSEPRLSTGAWTAIVTIGLIAVLVAVGLSSGGEDSMKTAPTHVRTARTRTQVREKAEPTRPHMVSVRLVASAEVWVCLLDASGRQLIDGRVLSAGTQEGPFHSGSFTVSFGNGEVSMKVDGPQASIPATASPIGYSIDSSGKLEKLSEGERPSCT